MAEKNELKVGSVKPEVELYPGNDALYGRWTKIWMGYFVSVHMSVKTKQEVRSYHGNGAS